VIVGVNKYRLETEDPIDFRDIDNAAVRDAQIARLKQVRATRDEAACTQRWRTLTAAPPMAATCWRPPLPPPAPAPLSERSAWPWKNLRPPPGRGQNPRRGLWRRL
jgi:hypothetical protein